MINVDDLIKTLPRYWRDYEGGREILRVFAESVAAREREACAKIAEDKANEWGFNGQPKYACEDVAGVIRARK